MVAADTNAAAVAETVAAITKAGGTAQAAEADAGAEDDVKGLVARALAVWGGLDVFYANAGISGGRVPLFEQPLALWQEVLRVNLIGPFLAIKHAGPVMVRQGSGSIVCTASVAGLRANAGGSPYAASKAGVISLVQTAANELYGTGVRVNAICPGLIETGMTKPLFDGARARGSERKIGQLNPLRRYGEPRRQRRCLLRQRSGLRRRRRAEQHPPLHAPPGLNWSPITHSSRAPSSACRAAPCRG